jgi:aspartyl-tRNA(Asn)/glutamyl-tRNA(Gln) amidotransferase subunit A
LKTFSSYSEIREHLLAGKISCAEVVSQYLEKINTRKNLNAFLEIFADEAMVRAEEVDKKIRSQSAGKLAGMVIALKDVICYRGHRVSASSKILEGFTSLFSSTATERLLAQDAIIIGRTNCDEFAMGSSNENSAYGNVLNPHDETRVPGGSSGGSVAAVAADLCTAALGTDTGGSIRQPASFCGVVGLKPTYGRVSRWGLLAYASSFDQIGPVTRTVDDAALILEVIAGADEYDTTASSKPVPPYPTLLNQDVSRAKIAVLKDCLEHEALDAEIKNRINEMITELRKKGHTVESIDFPFIEYLVPAYYVLTTAEASSNLSRYDGMRYGYRSPHAYDMESTYKKSRTEGFGREVKRRIMLGTFVLSAGYYDAYYSKGQKVRKILLDRTNEIFSSYDFILSPTTPGTAFKAGEISDPIKMYLEDIFTVLAPLAGFPAISLPMGKHSNGLPFGIQVMAKKFAEAPMLAFSKYLINNF